MQYVDRIHALFLEYNNPEGTIPESMKTKFQATYVAFCFTILVTGGNPSLMQPYK